MNIIKNKFIINFKNFFKDSFNFTGRISRKDYLINVLMIYFILIIKLIPFFLESKIAVILFIIGVIIDFLMILPRMALERRRFNDIGVNKFIAVVLIILRYLLKIQFCIIYMSVIFKFIINTFSINNIIELFLVMILWSFKALVVISIIEFIFLLLPTDCLRKMKRSIVKKFKVIYYYKWFNYENQILNRNIEDIQSDSVRYIPSVISFLKNTFNFTGQTSIKEYLWILMSLFIINNILRLLCFFSIFLVLYYGNIVLIILKICTIIYFILMIPTFSICIRRLNDIGMNKIISIILIALSNVATIHSLIMLITIFILLDYKINIFNNIFILLMKFLPIIIKIIGKIKWISFICLLLPKGFFSKKEDKIVLNTDET